MIQSRIFCGKYAGKEKSDNEVLYPDPDLIDFFSDFFCGLKLHIRIQTGNKRADIVNTHAKKSQKIHTFLCKKVGVGGNCRERPDRHPYLPSVAGGSSIYQRTYYLVVPSFPLRFSPDGRHFELVYVL